MTTIDAGPGDARAGPRRRSRSGRLKRSWLPERVTQYGLWILALTFVIGPIIPVLWASLWSTPLYEAGGSLTLRNFRTSSPTPTGGRRCATASCFAVLTTVGSVVLGCTLAVLFVRTNLPGRRFLRGFILLPVMIPGLALILGWASMYSPSGYVTRLIDTRTPFPVWWDLYSVPGMAMLAVGVAAPVVYLYVNASLASQDTALEMAALSAGASPAAGAAHGDAAAAAPGDPQLVGDRVRPVARGARPAADPRQLVERRHDLDLPLRPLGQRGAVAAGARVGGGDAAAGDGDGPAVRSATG